MSYDLAVFDPRDELKDRRAFDRWYDATEEYGEDGSYNDHTQPTPALQSWFHEMREHFVPRNGPFSLASIDDPRNAKSADYDFGPDLIYVCFSWSQAEEAYELCFALAAKHGVAFLDASGSGGAAWFPGPTGKLEKVHVHMPESEGE
jgi:hypothetical protein